MKSIIFFLAFVFLVSCKKDKTIPEILCNAEEANSKIYLNATMPGRYNWEYSRIWHRGSDPKIVRPGINYSTKRYEFNKNGEVSYYESGFFKWTHDYKIEFESSVSTYLPDSIFTMAVIYEKGSGKRLLYFRPYICGTQVRFFNPFSSIDVQEYYHRTPF